MDSFSFKRGDGGQLELGFYDGTDFVDMGVGVQIKLVLKEDGKYDGTSVVYLDVWSGSAGSYVGNPNFNTVALNTLLASGDADDTNDEDFVDLMMEISWSVDAGVNWLSSETVVARVDNDVIKGDEGVPVGGDPEYPIAGDVATKTYVDNLDGDNIKSGGNAALNEVGMQEATVASVDLDNPNGVMNVGSSDDRYKRTYIAHKLTLERKTNDDVPILDADMVLDLPIGKYKLEAYVHYKSTAGGVNGGLQIGVGGTAWTNNRLHVTGAYLSSVSVAQYGSLVTINTSTQGSEVSNPSSNFMQIVGAFNVLSAGTVGVRWAQYTAHAETTTVEAYSYIIATRLN